MADTYAANYGDLADIDLPAHITPAEVRFQNPLIVDAGGREWDNIPFDGKRYTSDAFASLARRRGYDGLVLRNVQDDGPLATSYAAVKPGTVFSPLTGERLYAGILSPPELLLEQQVSPAVLPGRKRPPNPKASAIRSLR